MGACYAFARLHAPSLCPHTSTPNIRMHLRKSTVAHGVMLGRKSFAARFRFEVFYWRFGEAASLPDQCVKVLSRYPKSSSPRYCPDRNDMVSRNPVVGLDCGAGLRLGRYLAAMPV